MTVKIGSDSSDRIIVTAAPAPCVSVLLVSAIVSARAICTSWSSCPSQGANTRAHTCTCSQARVGSEHHVNIIFSPSQSISWQSDHIMACRRRNALSSNRKLSARASALHRLDTPRLVTEKNSLDTKPLCRGCPACCLPVIRLHICQSYKP